MYTFRGTYTALITPFRDRAIDYAALERLVEHQIAAGIDGIVPCGTTGESPTLSMREHDEVIEHVIRFATKRVPVIAGAGSNSNTEHLRTDPSTADELYDATSAHTPVEGQLLARLGSPGRGLVTGRM